MKLTLVLAATAFTFAAWGQNPGATTQVNSQKQQVDVRQAKVVYVSGDDLVIKRPDGTVKHVVVPSDFRFHIDGKDVATKDLVPGTELTQNITTTTKEATVTNVRNIDVKVRQVNAP